MGRCWIQPACSPLGWVFMGHLPTHRCRHPQAHKHTQHRDTDTVGLAHTQTHAYKLPRDTQRHSFLADLLAQHQCTDWHTLGTHRTPTSPRPLQASCTRTHTHLTPCTRGPGTSVSHSGTLVAWASGLKSELPGPCHLPQQCSLSLPCLALSVHVTRSPLQTRNSETQGRACAVQFS